MSYVDIVICVGSHPILKTWRSIYRGQEGTVWDRLKASQVLHPRLLSYPPCLTEFTFEFIRRSISPILSPSSRTFVEFNPRQWAMMFEKQEVKIGLLKTMLQFLGRKEQRNLYFKCSQAKSLFGDDILKTWLRRLPPHTAHARLLPNTREISVKKKNTREIGGTLQLKIIGFRALGIVVVV
jgi:hypothetical protein